MTAKAVVRIAFSLTLYNGYCRQNTFRMTAIAVVQRPSKNISNDGFSRCSHCFFIEFVQQLLQSKNISNDALAVVQRPSKTFRMTAIAVVRIAFSLSLYNGYCRQKTFRMTAKAVVQRSSKNISNDG